MSFDLDLARGVIGEPSFPIAAAVTFAAGLLRGFSGFGSAMLMAPIFAVLFGSAEMVATVIAMELAISFHLFPQTRQDCRWSLVGPMMVAAWICMPLGFWLLVSVDRVVIQKTVSAIVAVFASVMFLGWRWRGPRGLAPTLIVGAISGAMNSTTGIGGPPVLLYLLSSDDPPRVTRANIIAFYFATQLALIAIVFLSGVVGTTTVVRACLLFPLMLLGSAIGSRLFRGADERVYRTVALTLLFAVGVFGLIS
ncbi:MAG: sulfite exporter TauE/SafE family protein [Alphaproteobacteria bacterium]|nr:sulfite exporter TauE/SafE family protein [Alphaproteobacteria bacterium]